MSGFKRIRLISAALALSMTMTAISFTASAESSPAEAQGTEISAESTSSTLRWPVPGFLGLSQGYTGEGKHAGIDICGSGIRGATVVSACAGTVYKVYKCTHVRCKSCSSNNCGGMDCDGFGTGVIIRGFDGRYYQYAHMTPGSIPSNIYKGATVTAGQTLGTVGDSGVATGPHLHFQICLKDGWHGTVNPSNEIYDTHSHSFRKTGTLFSSCTEDGYERYACSCGESYTQTLPATGHNYAAATIAPTMTSAGYIRYTCSTCSDSYIGEEVPVPTISADGWYYTDVLPSDISSYGNEIEYCNFYETTAASSPGNDWTYTGVAVDEWVNVGDGYESNVALETSDSRILLDTFYFHYCSATTGTVVNYEADSTYVHGDMVDIDAVNVERTGYDGNIPYYVLTWKSDGSRVYCSSGKTCDGSYGTHGNRSYAWYRKYWYQDRQHIVKYTYSKNSGWTDYADSSANKTTYRFKLANAVPTNVKAAASSKQITLSWNAVNGATGYIVKSADGKIQYTPSAIKNTSYTVTGLKNGKQYKFKVYACVGGKWYGSSQISKTPTGAPQNVKATASNKKIKLTWNKVSGATGYIVKSADGKTQYTKSSITSNSYTVTGLKNGTQYKFKVYAYSDGKWFGSSTVSKTPTGAPQNVKATAGSKKITLSWDKVDGAAGYVIKSADGKTQYTNSINSTSYTISGLKGGKQYKFKVYAYVDGKWYASATKTKSAKA